MSRAKEIELNIEKLPERIWNMYENGKHWQDANGYTENIPRFFDYYEGKQWGSIPKGTESMPRIVLNYAKLIINSRKSNITATPAKIIYKSDRYDEHAKRMTRFWEVKNKEINLEEINTKVLQNGMISGTYVKHWFWNNDKIGLYAKHKGDIDCEIIDPLNVVVANPQEEDIQRQRWVIIASRQHVDSIKEMADDDISQEDLDKIVHDSLQNNDYGTIEQDKSDLATVLTRYFRIDGEVYCERVVKGVVVNKPFPLTPDVDKEYEKIMKNKIGDADSVPYDDFESDTPDVRLPDSTNNKVKKEKKVFANLYPISLGSCQQRHNSYLGIGEIEGAIPAQQVINLIYSMTAYAVQMNAWGKWKVTPKALGNQKLTNEVGQIITDHDPSGNGITRIAGDPINSAGVSIVSDIANKLREVTGATEVLNGEVLGANMAAATVTALQAQASKSIDEERRQWWRYLEQDGRIQEMFFRLYYDEEEFSYKEFNEEGIEELQNDVIRVSDYEDVRLFTICESIGGTRASATGDIAFLDSLIQQGAITPTEYAKFYPDDAVSNKDDIIRTIESKERVTVQQLQAQIIQGQQQIEQMSKVIEKQGDVIDKVDSLVAKNRKLEAAIAEIYAGSLQKEDLANMAMAKYGEVYEDANFFANELAGMNKKVG